MRGFVDISRMRGDMIYLACGVLYPSLCVSKTPPAFVYIHWGRESRSFVFFALPWTLNCSVLLSYCCLLGHWIAPSPYNSPGWSPRTNIWIFTTSFPSSPSPSPPQPQLHPNQVSQTLKQLIRPTNCFLGCLLVSQQLFN